MNKVFLTWLTDRYSWHLLSPQEKAGASSLGLNEPRGVGYGVGVALGLVAMQGMQLLICKPLLVH